MDPQALQRMTAGDAVVFEQLVSAMNNPTNEIRSQAEVAYKATLDSHPAVMVRLLTAGLSHEDQAMKTFCSVMLRKAMRQDSNYENAQVVWDACDPETKAIVKRETIARITVETHKGTLHKLCDLVSDLASMTWEVPGERWTELLQHMQSFIASQQDHLMEAALLIFAQVVLWLDDEFQGRAGTMYTVLLNCLKHPNQDIQIAATNASSNFIQSLQTAEDQVGLHPLVRGMLDVVGVCLTKDDEEAARDILISLADLATDVDTRIFKPHMRDFANAMLQIASNTNLDEETRQLALEVELLLIEGRPALIRKDAAMLASVCQVCMGFLLNLEDCKEWHEAVEEEDADAGQDRLHEYGLEALDRIAKPIGGKHLMPVLSPMIQAWVVSPDWKKRQGSLMVIAQVAEGCRKVMLEDSALASLMALCCSAATDSHAHVKWACCQSIGQICTDLAPKVQKKHHGDITKALLLLMGPQEEPRVQAHASSAIVNFSDELDGNIVGLYAKQLCDRLVALLGGGNRLVQEGALTALSSVADSCQELFATYYDQVMPLLKQILQNATDKTQRKLRGKALECISLIGLAVGRERFMPDAQSFMTYLQHLHSTELDADDPMLTYMQSAGTRMCKCLGADFMPMLHVFMPACLASAGKKASCETFDADNAPEEDDDSYLVPIGDKILRINTACNQEKLNAFNMLSCYAEDLKEHFYPYCGQVARIMEQSIAMPLLNDEEMRRMAAMVLPSLLKCAQLAAAKKSHPDANETTIRELFELLMKGLLKGIDLETEPEVVHEMLESLEQLVDLANPGLLRSEIVKEIFEKLTKKLEEMAEAKSARRAAVAEGDFDEEDQEQMEEEDEMDDEVMKQLVSAVGALLRKFGDEVMPLVEKMIADHFQAMLTEAGRPEEDRWAALMLLTDVVEYAPSSVKYLPSLLPKLLEFSASTHNESCNTAVYTLGVIAEVHPTVYKAQHETILPVICQTVERLEGQEDWEHARDNAIAALGKVIYHHPDLTPAPLGQQLGSLWVNSLPLFADDIEAAKQHFLLHQFLLKNDSRILGADNANLLKIAEVFMRVIAKGDELLDSENFGDFTRFFASQLCPVVAAQGFNMDAAVAQLEPKDQQRFQVAMAQAAANPGP